MAENMKNFWLYLTGRVVSLIGSGIQMVAIPLYILDITGSGTMMGIFTMVNLIPYLIFSPFAGVLGDRWNKKNIMVWTDMGRGAAILILAGLSYAGTMNLMALLIAQVAVSLMNSLFDSSTIAMLPELVEKDFLPRANSLVSASQSASMILGPILGGVLYGFWGIKAIFLINGISFILSAVSEIFIRYRHKSELTGKLTIKSALTDIKEVLKYINNKKAMKFLLFFVFMMNIFFNAGFAVIMPYFYKITTGFSAEQYGVLMAFFMVGLLLGNILFGAFFHKKNMIKMVRNGLYCAGAIYVLIALAAFPFFSKYFNAPSMSYFMLMGSLELLLGLSIAFIDTPTMSLFQATLPKSIISKFFSIMMIASQLAVPFGGLVYGMLLDRMPSYNLLIIVSIMAMIIIVVGFSKAPKELYDMYGGSTANMGEKTPLDEKLGA